MRCSRFQIDLWTKKAKAAVAESKMTESLRYNKNCFKGYLKQAASACITLICYKGQGCRHAFPPTRNRHKVLSSKPFDTRYYVVLRNI